MEGPYREPARVDAVEKWEPIASLGYVELWRFAPHGDGFVAQATTGRGLDARPNPREYIANGSGICWFDAQTGARVDDVCLDRLLCDRAAFELAKLAVGRR